MNFVSRIDARKRKRMDRLKDRQKTKKEKF